MNSHVITSVQPIPRHGMSYSRRDGGSSGSPGPGLQTRSSMYMGPQTKGYGRHPVGGKRPGAPAGYRPRMPGLFSNIVAGEIPAQRLHEDDDFPPVLVIPPLRSG